MTANGLRLPPVAVREVAVSPRVSVRRAAALAASGPMLALLLDWLHLHPPGPAMSAWLLAIAVGTSLAFSLGAALLPRAPLAGRVLATAAMSVAAGAAAMPLADRPFLALALLLLAGTVTAWLWFPWPQRAPGPETRRAELAEAAAAAGWGLTAVWFLAVPVGLAVDSVGQGAVAASGAIAFAYDLRWLWRQRRRRPSLVVGLTVGSILAGLVAGVLTWGSEMALTLAALPAWATAVVAWRASSSPSHRGESWWEPLLEDPTRSLFVTFLAMGLLGGTVLSLPVCTTRAGGISLLDAMFTAFSAVCVTGLTVLDTPNDFTAFGQTVILLLIQVGGLGIMTFSTAALALLGRRMSLRHEASAATLLGSDDRGRLHAALRSVLVVTFGFELAGGLLLALMFLTEGDGLGVAVWRGVFTSISAFCNAGFALQTDSLVPYQQAPGVLHLVALLILAGGIGPTAIVALPALARRQRVPVQIRVILFSTAAVVVLPWLFVAVSEWSNTMAHLAPADRLHNAWLQSVTLRTAGFNSLDLTALRPATTTVMMVAMFIGGSPGSTAGGIKVTTAAVLLLAVVAAMRGRTHVRALGFQIAQTSVYKAVAVVTLGIGSVLAALVALQLTQTLSMTVALFEVVSALGTVGLTIGGTAELDPVGKIVIIACMFLGRVGPLTAFLLLTLRRTGPDWTLPERELPVG